MNPKLQLNLRTILGSILAMLCLALPTGTHAGTLYWDGNGTGASGNPPTSGVGGAGTWTSAGAQWWNGTAYQAWNAAGGQDIADFRVAVGAVTVSGTVNVNKINVALSTSGSAYSMSGGTVAFTGSPGIIDVNGQNSFAFSSSATGNLKVNATGSTLNLSSANCMVISGSTALTSFEMALNQDANHIILGNAAALGSGSATVKLTKGTLNLGNLTGDAFTFNGWPTDLAGGNIRARFNTETWTGATSLSANSGLMTRGAAGVSLVFSSAATINLNSSTLTADADSASSGIALNGAISGAGTLSLSTLGLSGGANGQGTTTLGVANPSFTGTATTAQNRGTLALNNINALQNATLNTGAAAGSQAVTFIVAGNNTYNIGALTGSDPLAIGANTISVGSKAVDTTFSGAIIGASGNLTKVGANTLTLASTNTYSGATTVSGGKLVGVVGGSSASSAVTVNSGAGNTLGISITDTAKGWTNAGVTFAAGTTALEFDYGSLAPGASVSPMQVIGNIDFGAVAISIKGVNLAAGVYPLITWSGSQSGTIPGTATMPSVRQSGVLSVSGSTLYVTIGSTLPLTWQPGDGTWNTSSNNWKDNLAATTTFIDGTPGDSVVFDNTPGSGPYTVTLNSTFQPASVTVDDIGYTISGSGSIAGGSTVLNKAGTGTLVLATANTYGGGTFVKNGTLALTGGDNRISTSGAVTVGDAGTSGKLVLGDGSLAVNQTVTSLVDSGSGGSVVGGNAANGLLTVNNSGTVTTTSALTLGGGGANENNLALTKSGAGTLTLAGANTYAGDTTIGAGTLKLGAAGVIPDGAGKGNVTVTGTLDLNGNSEAMNGLSGAGVVDTLSGGTPTFTVGGNDQTGSFSGLIKNTAGTLALTKSGSDALTLSGANTYSGLTTISGGSVLLGANTTVVTSGPLGNTNSGTVVASGATLDVNGRTLGLEQITISGTGVGGNGALVNNSGTDQINAAQRLALADNAAIGGTTRWDLRGTGNWLDMGGYTLTKKGTNYIALVGTLVTNTPGNIIVESGIFSIQLTTSIGGSSANTLTVQSGATLNNYEAREPQQWSLVLEGGSTYQANNGGALSNIWSGPVTLNGAATLAVGTFLTFSNGISGTGSIIKSGTGTATLAGNNSYDGVTTISGGILNVSHANGLGTTVGDTTVTNASLRLSGGAVVAAESVSVNGGGSDFFGALQAGTGGGTWGGQVTLADNAVRLGAKAGQTLTITGSIVDGVGTNINVSGESGTGTLVLNPTTANTYSGISGIVRGTLRLGKDDALPTGTTLDIDSVSSVSEAAIFDMAGFDQTVAALRDTATVSLGSVVTNSATSDPSTLTVTGASTFDGIIKDGDGSSTLSLVKSTGGTLTLKGVNTYTGNTTISGGTLLVNSPGSLAAGSAVTVDSTGTLGGNGTVNGTVTVQSGGTVAPGTSVGTLTFGTAPVLNGTILAEINQTNAQTADLLNLTSGNWTYGGALVVTNLGTVPTNGTFKVFDTTGTYDGAFSSVTLPPGGLNHWKTNNLVVDGTITFTNNAPVAKSLIAGVVHGGTVILPVIGGKNGATDADGDTVTILSVDPASSGSSGSSGSNVTYIASGTTGTNTFTYTVTDSVGATDTKTVTVVVSNPQGFNQVSAGVDGGNAVLAYMGIPGTNYALEITHDLPATNWVPVITNPASASGHLYFTNPISLSPTNDYYRTRYVP